jgi:hypothetical protein
MNFDARIPPDFPVLAGQPVWVFAATALIAMIAIAYLNNLYFAWLHRRLPWLFRPRVLLTILLLCSAVIAIAMVVNPPVQLQATPKPPTR